MRVELRPATAADFAVLYGDRPIPHRVRAVTAVADGQVIGVGGLGYRPDGTVIAFAEISSEMRRYPRAVHRAGRAGMALIRASGARTVYAEAAPSVPAAARWLESFGFRLVDGVYVWRRP